MKVSFCEFRKNGMGFCGLAIPHGDRCPKHVGKKNGERKSKSPKFRGKSKNDSQKDGWKGALE